MFIMQSKDEIIMRLVHYFVTEEDYTPMVVNGAKDEVWLQSQTGPYKIIRINSNYIHNNEQYEFDMEKLNNVMRQVQRKTLSFKVNALNILLDVNDGVKLEEDKRIHSFILTSKEKIVEPDLLETFPDINDKLLSDEQGFDLMLNVANDINKKTEKENRIYESIFREKKILVTYILIAINVIWFFVTYALANGNLTASALVRYGGLFSYYVVNGEVWRLVTAGFLHSSIIHLLFNMYSLYVVGRQVENFAGKTKFIIIYFVSLICASLMSAVISPGVVSVGASGAIFGLLGALVYFGKEYRLYFGSIINQIIWLIVINLLFGFMVSGVDNAAHIGGLIGGVLIAMAVGIQKKENNQNKINGLVCLVIYMAFLIYLLFFR